MKLSIIKEAFKDVKDKVAINSNAGDEVSHTVDAKQNQAIRGYTADSMAHNDFLHRRHHRTMGVTNKDEMYHEVNSIQHAIHSQPTLKDLHTFSGVQIDIYGLFLHHKVKPFSKIRFVIPSFTSTTTAFTAVGEYAKTFGILDAPQEFKSFITSHLQNDSNVRTYKNVLCFDLHESKALKIDKNVGGIFGDEEKEFILPHSISVEVDGTPTIYEEQHSVLVIWDAKIIESDLKTISKEEDSDLHEAIDTDKLKKLVYGLVEEIEGVEQIRYRVIRGLDRVTRQFENSEIETTGREMTYFESQFISLLFQLDENGKLESNLSKIKEIFTILKLSKKSLLSSPLSIQSSRTELQTLLGKIFDHG